MDLVGLADGLRCGLGDTQVTYLPGLDELLHRAPRFLYGSLGVHPVLVVEVYVVHPEPLQRVVAGLPHIIRRAVHPEEASVLASLVAELCGKGYLIAPVGDGLADELLVGERAVHVGGVEEGHAQFYGAVDGCYGFVLVARAVELAHTHASEAELRYLKALAAELTRFHGPPS